MVKIADTKSKVKIDKNEVVSVSVAGRELSVGIEEPEVIEVGFRDCVISPQAGDYPGPYEATPRQSTQVLSTAGKTLTENIVINPIPSNYGKITWDGSTLTVS